MSVATQYKCDVCGVLKGEADNWWMVGINDSELFLCTWDVGMHPGDVFYAFHLCGVACVQKRVSEFLSAS